MAVRLRIAAVALWLAATAHAASPADLYAGGDYDGAAAAARALGTPDALAFAARAEMSAALSAPDGVDPARVENAVALARAAVARAPENLEANVQLAASLGYRARIVGLSAARAENLPEQIRAAIDAARAIAPDDAYANTALGAWHFEIVRLGGPVLGDLVYGANVVDGLIAFERARTAAPRNPVVLLQFALTLLALDVDEFRARAGALLAGAAEADPANRFEELQSRRAREILALLAAGDDAAVRARVRRLLGDREP